jgi:hypothetical protein
MACLAPVPIRQRCERSEDARVFIRSRGAGESAELGCDLIGEPESLNLAYRRVSGDPRVVKRKIDRARAVMYRSSCHDAGYYSRRGSKGDGGYGRARLICPPSSWNTARAALLCASRTNPHVGRAIP